MKYQPFGDVGERRIMVSKQAIAEIEGVHTVGISSADILAFFARHEVRFSEATLRKWVGLGLLPRSVRVGSKGKHQGSRGLYPVRVIRQIVRIKEMMAQDRTIEEIQSQVLFVRGDIEALQTTLDKIFGVLDHVSRERATDSVSVRAVGGDLTKARALAIDLLARLEDLERRLSFEGVSERRVAAAAS